MITDVVTMLKDVCILSPYVGTYVHALLSYLLIANLFKSNNAIYLS